MDGGYVHTDRAYMDGLACPAARPDPPCMHTSQAMPFLHVVYKNDIAYALEQTRCFRENNSRSRDPESSSVVPGDPAFVHGALEFSAEHIPLARRRVPGPALLHPHPA